MKKFFVVLFMLLTIPAFATGVSSTASTADCDNATLNTYTGTSNLSAGWQPNTIDLHWYNGDTEITSGVQTSCVYDGTLTPPATIPTKTGYTFKGWTVRGLPDGYTRLQYIESTGTQYIDTGINIGENIQTKVKFGKTTNSFTKYGFIIGGGGHYQGLVTRTSTNSYYVSMYNSSQNAVVITMPDDVFEIIFNTPNHKVIINNSDSFDLVLISPYTINATIGIFNTPTYTTGDNIGIGKVYSFMIKDNLSNSVVRDMIPAKRNSDNVVGMWDTVSKTFFTNAGTGSFIAGPVVQ